MALAGKLATQADRLGKPGLTALARIFMADHSADDAAGHDAALPARISSDARLVGPAGAIHFGGTDTVQPDLLARPAVDRAIDVMESDGEADEGGDHRPPSHGHGITVYAANRARGAC
jgi:hypothetical protein